jgi:hypothetical protein
MGKTVQKKRQNNKRRKYVLTEGYIPKQIRMKLFWTTKNLAIMGGKANEGEIK